MWRLTAMLALIGALGTGCYAGVGVGVVFYDPYYWGYPYYDSYYYGWEGYLVSGWADAAGVTGTASSLLDPSATAAAIAAAAGTSYFPPGCASATASGATVQYRFSDCEGPFEVDSFSGDATLVVSEQGGRLALTAASSDLLVDGQPFVLDLSAQPAQAGAQRVATIVSRSHASAHVDARQTQGSVTWTPGSGCIEVSGEGDSARGALSVRSTVTSFRRCARQCPTDGMVTVESSDGFFSARFEGVPTMKVTAPSGERQSFALRCP